MRITMQSSSGKVLGEFSTKIKGLSEKPKYNKLSPLYSNHPHPRVHECMENIRLWLYGLSPLFEETVIIKFMRDGELHDCSGWKFYFDGVRLVLYIDIHTSQSIVNTEVKDGLYLAIQAVQTWYEEYSKVINTPVKYREHYDSKLHCLATCAALRATLRPFQLCEDMLKFAQDNIRARIAVFDMNGVCEEAEEELCQYPGERWYYSSGTFLIRKEDFDFTVLKQIREDTESCIETTNYWVERLLT